MGEYKKRGRVVVLLILIAFVFQGAVTVGSGDIPLGGEYGGTLRVALKNTVNLNPLTATDAESWKVIDIVYDSLFRLKTGENDVVLPEPWLAKGYTIVDDDTVIVELKQGIKWHDSTEVTADDVVYTFDDIDGMKNSSQYGALLANLGATKTGTYTVTFDLSNFDNKGLFFTKVMTIPIIPDQFDGSFENGCGPFKYSSFDIQTFSVTDEMIIKEAKGDETRASMKYRFVSPVGIIIKMNTTTWNSGVEYTLHSESGSIEILTFPEPMSNLTASYSYKDETLTLEAFNDYYYGRPYMSNIVYSFYPDNPNTEDFDEGVDKAIIDLILKNIDLIGFELTSIEVSGDRNLDVESGEVTKLSDETWKVIATFNNRTYEKLDPGDPQGVITAENEAKAYMNSLEGTFRLVKTWYVEENVTGTWTPVEKFESEASADTEVEDIIEDTGGALEIDVRITIVWEIREFFLALDENSGFKILYLCLNTQRTPLDDKVFRLALAMLMDRNTHKSLLGAGKEIGYSLVIPKNSYWYNESIPKHKLERDQENDPILNDIHPMLDSAGYLNKGSDGYRNLPTGEEFNLSLLIPSITTDSVESSIGSNIGQLFDYAGINVTVKLASWDEINTNVTEDNTTNFDMAMGIMETDIDPSFLFDLFHSTKNGTGAGYTNINNYVPTESVVNETLDVNQTTNMSQISNTDIVQGSVRVYVNNMVWEEAENYTIDYDLDTLTVTNATFDVKNDTVNITYEYRYLDVVLEEANGALDLEERQGHVMDILGIVAEDVPIIPLVYYKTLEAYDRTIYEGWVGMIGGIHNFWSMYSSKYVIIGELNIDVSVVVTSPPLESNENATIIVSAKDEEGSGIKGVYINLSAENEIDPNIVGVIDLVEGTTNKYGEFTTTYHAPEVTQVTEIDIKAIGVAERYMDKDNNVWVFEDVAPIAVYPLISPFEISVDRVSPKIEAGNSTNINFIIKDKNTLIPIQNASIKIEITPKGLDASASPMEGLTDASGTFITTFTANVSTETFFHITAVISKDGYEDVEARASIKVTPLSEAGAGVQLPLLEISLGVVIIALVLLLLMIMRLGGPKKPKEAEKLKEEREEEKETEDEGEMETVEDESEAEAEDAKTKEEYTEKSSEDIDLDKELETLEKY